MKKATIKHSDSLTKRLSKYGALTAAIAGVADASGQIIYEDVIPDYASVDLAIGIDFDVDGTFDFVIFDNAYPYIGVGAYNSVAGNSFLGSQPLYTYPFAMNSGDIISAGMTSWYGGSQDFGTMNFASCYGGIGGSNWCGVTDKYLGLRFQTGGQTYYGWARLDVNYVGDQFILKDYAYNSTPGEPILAGQQTLSLNNNEFTKTKIIALNKSIGMYQLPESVEYTIFDMTGKKVLNDLIHSNTYVVDAVSLNSGVYLVEIIDINTKATIRKKIVL